MFRKPLKRSINTIQKPVKWPRPQNLNPELDDGYRSDLDIHDIKEAPLSDKREVISTWTKPIKKKKIQKEVSPDQRAKAEKGFTPPASRRNRDQEPNT